MAQSRPADPAGYYASKPTELSRRLQQIQSLEEPSKQYPPLLALADSLSQRMNPYTVRFLHSYLNDLSPQSPGVPAAVQYLFGEFYNVNLQRFKEALVYYLNAKEVLPQGYSQLRLRILEREALLSLDQALLAQAMPAADSCIELARQNNMWFSLASCQRCKGIIRESYFQDDPQEIPYFSDALDNYRLALAVNLQRKDTLASLLTLYYIATSLQRIESKWSPAREYIDAAFQLIQPPSTDYLDFWAQNTYLLAKLQAENRNLDAAEALFEDAYRLFERNRDTIRLVQVNLDMARLYYDQGLYPLALARNMAAVNMAPEAHTVYLTRDLNHQLYLTYKAMGLPEPSLQAHERYDQAKDSIVVIARGKMIAAAAAEREVARNQELLARQNVQLANRQRTNIFLAIIVVSLFSLLIAVIRNARRARADRNTLAERNSTIEKQHEHLIQLSTLKNQFFTNVSHELRTPLTLILDPLRRLLRRQNFNGESEQLIQTAVRNATNLQQLVDELLDVNKIESERVLIEPKPVMINMFLHQVADSFSPFFEAQGLELEIDLDTSDEFIIHIDDQHLKKILNNLLSNAVKHSPSGTTVRLASCVIEDDLQIEVVDNGHGIYADDLPHIFERFYRSQHEDARVDSSSGIGLAISSELTRLMGGRLTVSSRRGEGSRFVISFPMAILAQETPVPPYAAGSVPTEDDQIPASVAIAAELAPLHQRATVMIVEDNPDMRDYLSLLLKDKYDLITAGNGKEALDRLASEGHPLCQPGGGLIISDLLMPQMDGLDLLKHLKSTPEYAGIPVIMLTAIYNFPDRLTALTIGVDDYLVKPFHDQELQLRIHNLLYRYQQRAAPAEDDEMEETIDDSSFVDALTNMDAAQNRWLNELQTYALEHLQDSQFSVSFLSNYAGMSERNFQRRIKQLIGITPSEYIKELRLHQARHLLETKKVESVKDAARMVGFMNPEYFSNLFTERFNRRPSSYL